MSIKSTIGIAFAIIVGVLFASSVAAQHAFRNTRTVDPSGNADETSIQAAIDFFGTPNVRSTVFIYAGVYDENIVLNQFDENIDLVGVDPQSVIIKPTTGVGVKIESGTETERNNAIRNLTIITDDDHGIEIVKGAGPGATMPKKITIQGVIIDVTGTDKDGILGTEADEVTIRNCDILSRAGHGVRVGNSWIIENSRIETEVAAGKAGVHAVDRANLTIIACRLFGKRRTIFLDDVDGADIKGSLLFSAGGGGAENGCVLLFPTTSNVRFSDSTIISDATGTDNTSPSAIKVDEASTGTVTDIVFDNCLLKSIAVAVEDENQDPVNTHARTVNHDMLGTVTLLDCDITAINNSEETTVDAGATGVSGSASSAGVIEIRGGTIQSVAAADRETDVYDLDASGKVLRVANVAFSKWKGDIEPASRARPTVQRTLDIDAASNTGVLGATSLTGGEQEITSGVTDPDVYRVLSVKGNTAGMDQDVFIIGTNFAGDQITERITLAGSSVVKGARPFVTVEKIILPAQTSGGQTVSVGTTSRMGLQFPIASTDNVLQQARKSSGATSYTIGSVGTVDVTFATVDAGPLTGGDSIEWVVLASD